MNKIPYIDSESKVHLVKNWRDSEDDYIMELVKLYGTKRWALIAKEVNIKYGNL